MTKLFKHAFRIDIIMIAALLAMALAAGDAEASWLIDPWRFHASAHGQTTCQECHEEHIEKAVHPDPGNVNKTLADFFSVEQCLLCHNNIPVDLEEGLHGSETVKDPDAYRDCLGCHDPHVQPLYENLKENFDPDKPVQKQCGACHEPETELPAFEPEDEACMSCHRLPDTDDPEGNTKIAHLCFHCHGQGKEPDQELTGRELPLINVKDYARTPHAVETCTACHTQAARYRHNTQKLGDCRACHFPHDEKVAHDAHTDVACEACHLPGIKPLKIPETGKILWKRERKLGEPSDVHDMLVTKDKAACRRCHFKGNTVGASTMILPAKSILCMPCHAATLSVGDTTTIIALVFFLLGLAALFATWLTGSLPAAHDRDFFQTIIRLGRAAFRILFSRRFFSVIKITVLDVLLQRRLFRRSRLRWLIHGLIFFPLLFRLSWGLVGLLASLLQPEWSITWVMLNKNYPATAFLFDLTGLMMITGVVSAFLRGAFERAGQPPGLPRQDLPALGLLGGIVIFGFILEGVRMAMTGPPANGTQAFVGYGLSLLFSGMPGLTVVYGYFWYIHAMITGAFVAYLPFSRLSHIILSPLVLAANAVTGHEKE